MAETIRISGVEASQVSDGFHMLEELYDHRITLYIALCQVWIGYEDPNTKVAEYSNALEHFEYLNPPVWRSKLHSDGTHFAGWFLLGIDVRPGWQITYHIPLSRWDETGFADTLDRAPEWDGHSSADVLTRLRRLYADE